MNNKTINFNCGQLIQLIGKTINFSEPLALDGVWRKRTITKNVAHHITLGDSLSKILHYDNSFDVKF